MASWFCPKCMNQVFDDEVRCSDCGYEIEGEPRTEHPSAVPIAIHAHGQTYMLQQADGTTGPTSRDVVELAMRLAGDEVARLGGRAATDRDCAIAGHTAIDQARAICDGIRQAMKKNEHPGE